MAQQLGKGETFGDARVNALYQLLCGDLEAAMPWVEQAIAERDISMMVYLRFAAARGSAPARTGPGLRLLNLSGTVRPVGQSPNPVIR